MMRVSRVISLTAVTALLAAVLSGTYAVAASGSAPARVYDSSLSGNPGSILTGDKLSSVSITLNDTDLTWIHTHGKDAKYPGNKVIITDARGAVNVSSADVELKGRGNTSWTYPSKKSYQIRFADKTKVLGMNAAKKWILIANAFDDSLIRNQVAFHLSEELGFEYTPHYEFVDLYIDGDYRGVYMLGEKIEISGARLDLDDPYGVLVELDNFFYDENEFYFFDSYMEGNCFALKEAVDEDTEGVAEEALDRFHEHIDEFFDYLFNTPVSRITIKGLERYIDIDSFANWYLVNEYFSNVEAYSTSWYWYCDGAEDVIHMGPVWDFDNCMGNKADFSDTSLMYFSEKYLFERLLSVPAFHEFVQETFYDNIESFSELSSYAAELAESISKSADENFIRWNITQKDVKKPDVIETDYSSYGEAVDSLCEWLDERFEEFDP